MRIFPNLQNHPFAVEAHFESSVVLTFSVPKEELESLIPTCLELDTYEDKWAFIAIAMVQTQGLRPKGFPRFMGNDFFLIGYRIFVRFNNAAGKRRRGLYIIKSETNKKKMEVMGNMFTHYHYTTTDINRAQAGNKERISSRKSQFSVEIDRGDAEAPLPSGSPFPDWKTARRYAGPLPFTFTHEAGTEHVLIIEGVRQNWTPEPLRVEQYQFQFLEDLQLRGLCLANAFEIKDVPYHWKKGVKERWK